MKFEAWEGRVVAVRSRNLEEAQSEKTSGTAKGSDKAATLYWGELPNAATDLLDAGRHLSTADFVHGRVLLGDCRRASSSAATKVWLHPWPSSLAGSFAIAD